MVSNQSPSQTVGPFFSIGMIRGGENILTADRTKGQRIIISGQVTDGDGQPIPDAVIEIWQADAQGHFNHPSDANHAKADPAFLGFGRAATNAEGGYWFKTIKPGPVAWDEQSNQAPHVNVRVFARGMLMHALTRLYFSDEPANNTDYVLNSLPEPERRQTLIATFQPSDDLPCYCFNIRLQGEGETVFFNP
jgi:protocatechuate 3,4-dioxygenase, alpha subunit